MTPEKIGAFVDDLAKLTLRHGIIVTGRDGMFWLEAASADVGGYAVEETLIGHRAAAYRAGNRKGSMPPHYISSLDVGELSNHQRMSIMGGQW
ncbi:MAG: hypothetical protein FJX25_08060 [Alphaproteobacteria bacterium]|nr:hypothetical protein [Alphaproteobacteria bacterium]